MPFICVLLSWWWTAPLWAHSMLQSSVLLDFRGRDIGVELQCPLGPLSRVLGERLSPEVVTQQSAFLEGYIARRLRIYGAKGEVLASSTTAPPILQWVDGAAYVVVELDFKSPSGADEQTITLEDDVITDTIASHAVLVTVRSDWQTGIFANDPQLLDVLTGDSHAVVINRSGSSWFRGFSDIFHLGVRHIAEGTDHLLFLLALLLPAPLYARNRRWAVFAGVRHGFEQILKVVTAFTVGHSLTLALAASGVVRVPERPIEVLIAVSILVSAIHAWRPLFPGREAFIAGAFGLIHGLAFASTLAELGLERWDRIASIFSFNLGIECMQLVVVAAVMPSLMLLSRTTLYPWIRRTGAGFAAVAATGWIVERSFGVSSYIDAVVNRLAQHAEGLAVGLFFFAIAATCMFRRRVAPEIVNTVVS